MVGPASSATRERREQTRSYSEGVSGRSDTGRCHVCPCGRSHPTHGKRRETRRAPVEHSKLASRVYDALADGKAEQTSAARWVVNYAGNCEAPLPVKAYAASGALFTTTLTRCRRCRPCLRAKQFYWARAAMRWTESTARAGLRTWFGTLTLTQAWQDEILREAREADPAPDAAWWDEAHCDERFRLVRNVLKGHLQRYWKRLRKGTKRCLRCYPTKPRSKDPSEWDHPPAQFKYFAVFERHKSGLPHIHWLLHETGDRVLLKTLACQWPYGFVKIKVVKGDEIARAGFYVSKYLGKAFQARQIASTEYASSLTSISN